MDYSKLTKAELVRTAIEKQEEIVDLEEALKASDSDFNRVDRAYTDAMDRASEYLLEAEKAQEKVEELQHVGHTTVLGEQKQQILEKLKRLDLETLEVLEIIYGGHILGFEEILD